MTDSSDVEYSDDYSDFDYDESTDPREWPAFFTPVDGTAVATGMTFDSLMTALAEHDPITASLLRQQADALAQGDQSAAAVDYSYLRTEVGGGYVNVVCVSDREDKPVALDAFLRIVGHQR